MRKEELSKQIKIEGQRLGFDLLGISKAVELVEEAKELEQWLIMGRQGKMGYMANHFDKRIDPRRLVPGAKSVISVIHNYYPQSNQLHDPKLPKVSRYAWGLDYHKVLKQKLYRLFESIHGWVGTEVTGRVFVDSAPVMDKAWAKRSGLGWIGKHTNLISPHKGSYFFIGEIILDLELVYDGPIKDYCGTCTRCIDACPTEALQPYQIDSNKCISYLTIELKEECPEEFASHTEGWVYGCDICQEVCPWNRFQQSTKEEAFRPLDHISVFQSDNWEEIDERSFKKLTKKTAMNRIKWNKMKSNLNLFRLWRNQR